MSFINDTTLILISVLHMMVILFVLMAPFSNNNAMLLMHIVVVPFIILHWVMNNDSCVLTLVEKQVRKFSHGIKPSKKDLFVYQFIAPIYDFNKNYDTYSTFIYYFTFSLWTISLFNLSNNYLSGKMTDYKDLLLFRN